ncbi:N-alpha-acetyltransferase 40-like [Schistocerca cancellata]|uniref:N-alpha-acetyltransferase 40-like n=1 Tax=Schistocerca cancellata TaxID=274614 RepID=UPI0021193975|nr:N-alpha-acetyltransferase 40-like [Schistocerca cancellata]
MGRKTSKGKEKRLQQREEALQIAAAKAVVDKANAQEDPLAPFPAFRNFSKNGVEATLSCVKSENIDNDTWNWIFNLLECNMKPLYNSCSWGWNEKVKKEELTDERALYLVARDKEGKALAFSHFRFDLDYGVEVLYCYELQLEAAVRRKGLGKFMMQVLELMGFSAKMKKVVLTVLKHNPDAMNFFTALRYSLDETSPEDNFYEEFPYVILSKPNKKLLSSV